MIDDVSREALERYKKLLLKWNKVVNLISSNSEEDIWHRHIMDSWQLMKYINISDRVIDVGSGAGFPGIVLSICGVKKLTLVESDLRKAVFLRQVAKFSTNRIDIITTKIDKNFTGRYDILTCRGFSNIKNILELTTGLEINKKLLLLKGETYQTEVKAAQKDWLFNIKHHDSITSLKGKILEITNARKSNFSS